MTDVRARLDEILDSRPYWDRSECNSYRVKIELASIATALRAEADALAKDAARWRQARKGVRLVWVTADGVTMAMTRIVYDAEADATVDAAIAKEPQDV